MTRKIIIVFIAALSLHVHSQTTDAQPTTTAPDSGKINGLILGAQFNNEFLSNTVGVNARYWHDNFGASIGASFYNTDVEEKTSNKSTSIDSLGFNFALLFGKQIKRFKPHAYAGISYNSADQVGSSLSFLAVRGGLGLDAYVMEHLVIGTDILNFSYIFKADIPGSSKDYSGHSFGFFNMFRLGYLF